MTRTATIISAVAMILASSVGANATLIAFKADLSGPAESPPNASPGIGTAEVDVDTVAQTLHVSFSFSGLTAGTTASHIHCCTSTPGSGTAIVATQTPFFTGFTLGVTSGSYDHTFDLTLLSTYNSAFVTAHGGTALTAETALLDGMLAGESYLNIHTTAFPTGEIRGFLSAVPEPGSLVALSAALLSLAIVQRRRRT